MTRLSKKQIIRLHSKLIVRYGGLDGIRDENALDAAVEIPFQTFGGDDLYPSVTEKAVRLAYGLILDHPFIDGNKRIGTMAMLMFLELNHISLVYDEDDLISVMLSIASGKNNDHDLLNWIMNHQAER